MTEAQQILDCFENFLADKGIEISNPERIEEESAALIYGSDYAYLENEINRILNS